MSSEGVLIVVSGPSGVGKDTIVERFLAESTSLNCTLSVSATTRQPRLGEKDTIDYYFISEEEFLKYIKSDQLLEYTRYNGNYYGTLKSTVQNQLAEGKNVILIIETDGAQQVQLAFPQSIQVFIMPPSFEELRQRIHSRSIDSHEQISSRLKIAEREIEEGKKYAFCIVNDSVGNAVKELGKIITSELKLRQKRIEETVC